MYVTITISDSAPPHAEHERARLFEPFYGVHLADGGSGLALATLHGFMRQSGGAVVLDTPATGRRVRLFFPAAAPGAGTGATGDDGNAPSSGTVLLAEDEPTVRLLMKRVLQRAGFVVLVASDGEEALQISRTYSSRIDVLVSDVIMPRMGGGELSRRLRQERPEIRVLHVSGYTAGALRQHEALDDSAAFLQKPFTPKALISRLREVLAG
jgi:CheY-like chemotaxis protein